MDIEERLKQLQNKLDSRMNDIQQRSNSTMDRYGIQSPTPTFTANTAGNSFCPQCGASVENDAMFCNMCGSRLVTSSVQENKNERRKVKITVEGTINILEYCSREYEDFYDEYYMTLGWWNVTGLFVDDNENVNYIENAIDFNDDYHGSMEYCNRTDRIVRANDYFHELFEEGGAHPLPVEIHERQSCDGERLDYIIELEVGEVFDINKVQLAVSFNEVYCMPNFILAEKILYNGRDIEVYNENGEYSDRGIDGRYCEEYYVNSFNDSRDSEKNDIDNICDLLHNMIIEDEDGNVLVDTRSIDSDYTDVLISALEKWLGDELYMKFGEDELEDVDTEDFVDDVMMNRSCVRRELVKFACIVSQGDEPETEGNNMFEWPESLDYDAEYTIKFPDIEMEFTWTGSDDE